MAQDIRDFNKPLCHWHEHPGHPGYDYCYTVSLSPFRIHIARKSDFKVLGSFPCFVTADATMQKLYQRAPLPEQAA